MDEKRLAEIQARHAAATQGPWSTDGACVEPPEAQMVRHADGSAVSLATAWGTHSPFQCMNYRRQLLSGSREGNAAFIAHSWQDVGDLLGAVKAARLNEASAVEAVRLLEAALLEAEARLGEVGYTAAEARCDRALREARALMNSRTPTEGTSAT